MQIDIGDIIALRGKGIIANLISRASGLVSHIGVVTKAPSLDYSLIDVTQAVRGGVITMNLAETLAHAQFGYCLHSKELDTVTRAIIGANAELQIGQGYAYANIFWQAIKSMTGHSKWTEYMSDEQGVVCSELAAYAYLKAGLDFNVPPRDCTPTDILHYAMASEQWLVQPL